MNLFTTPFFLSKKIPFGLDLSDMSVKIVHFGFGRGGKKEVLAFGLTTLSPGSIVDGEIKNPESVRQAIVRCMQESNVRSRRVFCSLPEGKSFLRIIEMPNLSDKELKESIQFQIEENIPMGVDQLYYDWMRMPQSFSRNEKKVSILLVAVARNTADIFLETVESAGLEVVGMGTESVAQVKSLLSDKQNQEKKEVVLLIDLGDRRTTVIFSVGGIPCFASSAPLSSQMMTEAIAQTLRVSSEEAERIKLERGIGSFVKKDPVFIAVESVLEHLVNQVRISMDFFTGGLGFSRSVDRIVLCGGGASTKGLAVYLGKRLGKAVEKGDPWARMHLDGNIPPIPYDNALRYSTAIGLAWQGLQSFEEE